MNNIQDPNRQARQLHAIAKRILDEHDDETRYLTYPISLRELNDINLIVQILVSGVKQHNENRILTDQESIETAQALNELADLLNRQIMCAIELVRNQDDGGILTYYRPESNLKKLLRKLTQKIVK